MEFTFIEKMERAVQKECRAILMVGGGSVPAVEFRGEGFSMYALVREDILTGGTDTVRAAMHPKTSIEWLDLAVPMVLASDRVDAMTKLRLAARWAEAKV
jgi:hypothetical protein